MVKTKTDFSWSLIDSFSANSTDPVLTMYRPCPVCGGHSYQTLLILDDFQFFSDAPDIPKRTKIQDVQCSKCNAIYLNPCYSAEGFACLFSEAGQSYGSTEGRPLEQVEWLKERQLLGSGKVFLDVGCYDGRFLSRLPDHLQRIGVDIDKPSIESGNKKFGDIGIQLIHGPLEKFNCPIPPDVISMFHVLEHLANPLEVLRHLREISHPETRLIVEVPVLQHGKTNDINGFFSVQHMTHFSLNSLNQLLLRAGWGTVESKQMPDYNGHRLMLEPVPPLLEIEGDVDDRTSAFEYLAAWYKNLAEINIKMKSWLKSSKAVLWGGGMHSEFLYQVTTFFRLYPDRKYIIVDSDPLKQGKTWRGVPIHAPDVLNAISWDDCRLIPSTYGSQENILAAARGIGVPETNIDLIYDRIRVY
jgi:SAM-dependent methyltransferase